MRRTIRWIRECVGVGVFARVDGHELAGVRMTSAPNATGDLRRSTWTLSDIVRTTRSPFTRATIAIPMPVSPEVASMVASPGLRTQRNPVLDGPRRVEAL
jgi:hypothetical protein